MTIWNCSWKYAQSTAPTEPESTHPKHKKAAARGIADGGATETAQTESTVYEGAREPNNASSALFDTTGWGTESGAPTEAAGKLVLAHLKCKKQMQIIRLKLLVNLL